MSAISVKIECDCGQHYAFDVEPINGQMPAPVCCPVCGADGTGAANASLSHATSGSPRLVPADTSRVSRQGGRLVPGLRAPANDGAKTDWIEAKLDIKRATSAAVIVAGLDLLLAILSLCGIQILGADLWILVDVVIVLALAYGIHRFSRTCAILMVTYYLAVCIYAGGKSGISGIISRAVFLYYFGRGAQAMFTYHKLKNQGN